MKELNDLMERLSKRLEQIKSTIDENTEKVERANNELRGEYVGHEMTMNTIKEVLEGKADDKEEGSDTESEDS